MNQETPLLADSIDEELVAYLDGELDAEGAARVERRLADDASYRARLAQLQRAWDLLDTLHRAEADDDFVRSTVEMVAIRAEGDAKTGQMRAVRQRSLSGLGLTAIALVSAVTTYFAVQYFHTLPDRQLVRDLPVIERIDEYSNLDYVGIEFLQQLHQEGLFTREMNDETQPN